jgi:hypothetical protein
MNLQLTNRRRHQSGLAVFVVVVLLSLISLYVAMNARTLSFFKRELGLVEEKQLRRIQAPRTEAPAKAAAQTEIERPAAAPAQP